MARILIVDDENALADLLRLFVEDAGHEGEVAHNGVEALQLAHQTHFDLIISDVMMPLMSGTELLAELRADPALYQIPVVLISAAVNPPQAASDVAIYLVKPFDLAILDGILARLLAANPNRVP